MSENYFVSHHQEIIQHKKYWSKKKVLQTIYFDFYTNISQNLRNDLKGFTIELGSGLGNIKNVIKDCICTDIVKYPWIDKVENAYELSFSDETVSNIILFDVWMYLKYPGNVLKEFNRVLKKGGRIIIFEPDISLLGFIVYNFFHHLDVNYYRDIEWWAPEDFSPGKLSYYVAQGNASRIFRKNKFDKFLTDWTKVKIRQLASIDYILSGGYSKPQLYPDALHPIIKSFNKLLDLFPMVFSTRLLIVLEKK